MIFILGIDALDYELVEKINLNNLKQLEYGKVIVPIHKELGVPLSPEVWASFLAGIYISKDFKKPQYFTRYLLKLIPSLRINSSKGFLNKFKFLYNKLFTVSKKFGNLNVKTFLDTTQSMEINVPFYSFDNKTFDIVNLFGTGKLSLNQTIKEIDTIYEMRKNQIINEIDNIENEDVVFAFMHTTDVLQHMSFINFSKIRQHYKDLDNYVSVLKRKLEDSFRDIIFIIVSDHGFDFGIGDHSKYAFYSSNHHLIPKPEKITDFYGIILDLVNKSTGLSSS